MKSKISFCRASRGARRPARSNGFTLMELLIVMAIIAILMLIAIPTVGSLKKKADDLSAVQSVHTILNAESMYESNYPTAGYACSLAALGGDPKAGAPTMTAAQLISPDLAGGVKSGYVFNITNCTKVNQGGSDRITGYQITATPLTVGQTGDRAYCGDQSGAIKFDPAGGTNCTQNLGQ
jgi:type IV pilus assembly protein PilA